MDKTVFFSVITRNQEKCLPIYFRCIDELDYDKENIVLYINTNNNDDNTIQFLTDWIEKNHSKYKKVIFERGIQFKELSQDMGWEDNNSYRLKLMSKIRNRSLDLCRLEKTDYYFCMDTDNWIAPCTLKYLVSQEKPIIAPFLRRADDENKYSNFFSAITESGYFAHSPQYDVIFYQWEKGLFNVPVVHCTYLIDCKYLNQLAYNKDGWPDYHYEFVLFSVVARSQGIDQFISNEKVFGFVRYHDMIDDPNCYNILMDKYKNYNLEQY